MGNCCSGDAALPTDVSKASLSLPNRNASRSTSPASLPPKVEANRELCLTANGMLEKVKASPPKVTLRHSVPLPSPPTQHVPRPTVRHGNNAHADELFTDTLQVSETTETGARDCDPDDMTLTELVDVSHPTLMHHGSDMDVFSDMDFTSYDAKARVCSGSADKEKRFQNYETEKRYLLGRRIDSARHNVFSRGLKERIMHERSEMLRAFFIERLSLFLQVVEADEFLRRQLILSEWRSSIEHLSFAVLLDDSPARTCEESQPPCRSATVEGDLTSSEYNDEEETTAQMRSSSISVRGLSRPQQAESVYVNTV